MEQTKNLARNDGDYVENEQRTQVLLRQLQGLDEASLTYRRLVSEIIELNLHVVDNYVSKFVWGSQDANLPEYQAAGLYGLWQALQTYDVTKGSPFHAWARGHYVKRAVLKAVHKTEYRHLTEDQFALRSHVKAVERKVGSGIDALDDETIAEIVGASVEQVTQLREADHGAPALPTEDSDHPRMVDANSPSPEEILVAAFEHGVAAETLKEVVDSFDRPSLVLFIVIRHLGLDGEPKEGFRSLGRALGVSRKMVRQIYKDAADALEEALQHKLDP